MTTLVWLICQNKNGQMDINAKNAGITNLPSGRRTLQWTATGATM
jgi:hypothetical protein